LDALDVEEIKWLGRGVETPGKEEGVNHILARLDRGMDVLESLPTESRLLPRVELLENALSVNKSTALRIVGRATEAIALCGRALESDQRILGSKHAECAHDMVALAVHYLAATRQTGKDKVGQGIRTAERYLVSAREIYSSPGPSRNLSKVADVDELLAEVRRGAI